MISTSPFMLITLQFFSNNPPPPSTPDCSKSSISKTIPTLEKFSSSQSQNLEFLAEPYTQDQVTSPRILAMAAVHPPTDSLGEQNILKCAILASEFSNLSLRNFLHIELPGKFPLWSSSQTEKILEKPSIPGETIF
jgi:hypothetical protein